jgi:hypothetical protein
VNRFLVLSLQKSVGDLNYQVSAFHQYSELHYTPDPVGDLVYNGVASDTLRSNSSSGVQFDASYKLNDSHTVRAGVAYARQNTHSDNSVAVFDTDARWRADQHRSAHHHRQQQQDRQDCPASTCRTNGISRRR